MPRREERGRKYYMKDNDAQLSHLQDFVVMIILQRYNLKMEHPVYVGKALVI